MAQAVSGQKVVLVTGGTRGIGFETCKAIANYKDENGNLPFKVYGTGRGKKENCDNINFMQLDVTSDESVQSFMATLMKTEKKLDIFINNAGISLPANAVETTPLSEYEKVMSVNYFGAIRMMQAVIPIMRKQAVKADDGKMVNGGTIINMSSCISLAGFPFMSGYTSTKAALDRITEAAKLELAPVGIEVRVISPGAVKTEFDSHVANNVKALEGQYPQLGAFMGNSKKFMEYAILPNQVSDAILEMVNGKRSGTYREYPTKGNEEFHSTFCKDPTYSNFFNFAYGALLKEVDKQ